MNLLRLIERNLQLRRLSSALTSLSVALGVMLVAAILVLRAELSSTYLSQGEGYSLIVGPAGGSPLSLVLNAVYHVEKSSGLIPYSVLGELESGANRRLVRLALPYAMGDSFRGFPVVATTDAVFSRVFPYPRGDTPEDKLRAGRPFRFRGEDLREALDDLGRLGGEDPDHDHAAADEHDHAHDHAHGSEGIWEAVVGAEVLIASASRSARRSSPPTAWRGARSTATSICGRWWAS